MSYERARPLSQFPSCCGVRDHQTLGFSLNPLRLVKKIARPLLKSKLVRVATRFLPGGFVAATAVGIGAGLLASRARRRKGIAPALARAQAIFAARRAQAVTGPTPSAVSDRVPAAPAAALSMARPADLSDRAAETAAPTGGPEPPEAPTAAGPAGPGSGIGIAVLASLALLAFAGRKPRSR